MSIPLIKNVDMIIVTGSPCNDLTFFTLKRDQVWIGQQGMTDGSIGENGYVSTEITGYNVIRKDISKYAWIDGNVWCILYYTNSV